MHQKLREQKLSSKPIFQGRYLNFHIDTVQLPNGNVSTREMVDHPGAVAVVAVTPDDRITLVWQYRYPVNDITLEIPAGKLKAGEDPLACAKRELEEETGYRADQWKLLTCIYTAPGFSNETIHIYLAEGLTMYAQKLDDDEFVETQSFSHAEISQLIESGKICDAKTIVGLKLAGW